MQMPAAANDQPPGEKPGIPSCGDALGVADDNYILMPGNATVHAALAVLEQRSGNLDWALLARGLDGVVLGATFGRLLDWERAQPDRSHLRSLTLLQVDPLLPLETVEDCVNREAALEVAARHPYGLAVVTMMGTQVACGILRAAPAAPTASGAPEMTTTRPAATATLADRPLAGPDGSPAETRKTLRGEKLSFRASGPLASVASSLRGLPGRLVAVYHMHPLRVLISCVSFLVFVAFPVVWMVYTDVLPRLSPQPMTGEWNIAVAPFTVAPGSTVSRSQAADMSNVFYNVLAAQMAELGQQVNVAFQLLEPGKTGAITGDTPEARAAAAAERAAQLNADLVIYGTLSTTEGVPSLRPEFYVASRNRFEAQEMVGQHALGGAIALQGSGGEASTEVLVDRELARRARVFALVSRGLSLYFATAYSDALALFRQANSDTLWDFRQGREVLYLFEGNAAGRALDLASAEAAFRKALEIEPEYARAQVGLGSVYYSRSMAGVTSTHYRPDIPLQDEALAWYARAEAAAHRPPTADIGAKVAFGRAEIYLARHFAGQDTVDEAAAGYQAVIREFERANKRVQELASESHARLGMLAREQGRLSEAVEQYLAARNLALDPARQAMASKALAGIYSQQGTTELAAEACRRSIAGYTAALPLVVRAERRAGYWEQMADCYEQIGQRDQAAAAVREAIALLPTDSEERRTFVERLAGLER